MISIGRTWRPKNVVMLCVDAKFPKVTVCQNSLHSRKLVERNLPFMLKLVGLGYHSRMATKSIIFWYYYMSGFWNENLDRTSVQ